MKSGKGQKCECGCGGVSVRGRFMRGHNIRINNPVTRADVIAKKSASAYKFFAEHPEAGVRHSAFMKDLYQRGKLTNPMKDPAVARKQAQAHSDTVRARQPEWYEMELRICSCGCEGQFECSMASSQMYIHGHNTSSRIRMDEPNKSEVFLWKLIREAAPGVYELNVRKGAMAVGSRFPDYISRKHRKAIEFFGKYWHSEMKTGRNRIEEENVRIKHFKKNGYDTLIIWEEEIHQEDLDSLCRKIIDFTYPERFNEHNQNIPSGMVVCSELTGDRKRSAEMIDPLSKETLI